MKLKSGNLFNFGLSFIGIILTIFKVALTASGNLSKKWRGITPKQERMQNREVL